MTAFAPTASAPTGTAYFVQAGGVDPGPDPDPGPGTGPGPIVIPIGAPNIYAATIMRRSFINMTTSLGPASINLTVRLP